jgi:hypothetical protein
MNTLDVLVKARELVSAPERWTQRSFARSSLGNTVKATSRHAVCWCTFGALQVFGAGVESRAYRMLRSEVGGFLGKFNDTHTHAEVLAAFDAAIEAERAAL